MALILITGAPGTGKTLYGIQKYIIPELQKGTIVRTNIDGLVFSRISILFNIDIFQAEANLKILENPAYFYREMEKNEICVLDESQNIYNNRDWQSKENQECLKYLNEHRHYGHRVVFITPHIESLDAGIRRIAEFTYKHKSFSAIGNQKTVRCAVFPEANLSRPAVQYFTWKHDPRIYDCYKSYFEKGTIEKKVRVHPLRNTLLYILFIIIFVSGFFFVKNTISFSKKFSKKNANIVNLKPENTKVPNIIINGQIWQRGKNE